MKKILSLAAVLLSATLLSTTAFAAPTPETVAYKAYQDASKQLDNVSHMAVGIKSEVTIDMMGETVSMPMRGTLRYATVGKDDIQMEVHMTTMTNTDDIKVDMYYRDGYMYQNTNGAKTKTKMDFVDALASANSSNVNTDLTYEMMKDLTLSDIEGGQRVQFLIPSAVMESLIEDPMSSILSDLGDTTDFNIKISDILYRMDVSDSGKPLGYQMLYSMKMGDSNFSFTTKYNTTCTILSTSRGLEINFPNDMNMYKEV